MNLSKVNSIAKISLFISIAILGLFVVISFLSFRHITVGSSSVIMTIISNVISIVICFLVMLNVIAILRDISLSGTPFKMSNVIRLKRVGILLIIFEPATLLFQFIENNFMVSVVNGSAIKNLTSFGGMIFVIGWAVICLSAIFKYGVELQKQSDETL